MTWPSEAAQGVVCSSNLSISVVGSSVSLAVFKGSCTPPIIISSLYDSMLTLNLSSPTFVITMVFSERGAQRQYISTEPMLNKALPSLLPVAFISATVTSKMLISTA